MKEMKKEKEWVNKRGEEFELSSREECSYFFFVLVPFVVDFYWKKNFWNILVQKSKWESEWFGACIFIHHPKENRFLLFFTVKFLLVIFYSKRNSEPKKTEKKKSAKKHCLKKIKEFYRNISWKNLLIVDEGSKHERKRHWYLC